MKNIIVNLSSRATSHLETFVLAYKNLCKQLRRSIVFLQLYDMSMFLFSYFGD